MIVPRWKRQEWREYRNAWRRRVYRERREEYFADKVCIDCGAGRFLEIDHVDKRLKVSHKIWLWGKERREKELSKCVVRCDSCHNRRHANEKKKGKDETKVDIDTNRLIRETTHLVLSNVHSVKSTVSG